MLFPRKIRRYIVGVLCLILGVVGGLLPILQGWVFLCLGLLILKDDIKMIHCFVEFIKKKWPKASPAFINAEKRVDGILHRWHLK